MLRGSRRVHSVYVSGRLTRCAKEQPIGKSPVETWTDEETAFERTANEELVEEDKEDLMPFPEDEASA